MKEIKNKKTGRVIEHLTEEQYKQMLKDAPPGFMSKFIVTDINVKTVIPFIKPKTKKE